MATTELKIGNLGDIQIQTGKGNPNHSSYPGTVYLDKTTGFLYKGISGTTWQYIGSTYSYLIYDFSGATTSGGTVNKYVQNIGDNISTTINVNHGLNSEDVLVEVYRNGVPKDTIFCDIERVDANNIQLLFANPPTTNEYRVIIIS
jgi:hypothetical protein